MDTSDLSRIGVRRMVEANSTAPLLQCDVRLCSHIFQHIRMDIQVVRFDMKDDGYRRPFFEVPQLEATQLEYHDMVRFNLIETVECGDADVSYKMHCMPRSAQHLRNETAGCPFALGSCNADNRRGATYKELVCSRPDQSSGRYRPGIDSRRSDYYVKVSELREASWAEDGVNTLGQRINHLPLVDHRYLMAALPIVIGVTCASLDPKSSDCYPHCLALTFQFPSVPTADAARRKMSPADPIRSNLYAFRTVP